MSRDDATRDGGVTIFWMAVMVAAVVVGLLVAQLDVFCGAAGGQG